MHRLCLPPHPRSSACHLVRVVVLSAAQFTHHSPWLEWSTDADNHASGRAYGGGGGRQQPNYRTTGHPASRQPPNYHCPRSSALFSMTCSTLCVHLNNIRSQGSFCTSCFRDMQKDMKILIKKCFWMTISKMVHPMLFTPHRKLRKFLPNFAVIVAKFCDTTLPKFAKFFW